MNIFEKLFKVYDEHTEGELKARLSEMSLKHLTFSHYEYLAHIHAMNEPTLGELADQIGLSKPSVTVMVNKLIKENLVVKVQDEIDRRTYHVKLTDVGTEVVELEKRSFMKITDQILSNLDEKEQEVLKSLLEKGLK